MALWHSFLGNLASLLKNSNLANSPGMTLIPAKWFLDEGLNQLEHFFFGMLPSSNRDHVGVVV
jgi:hypothetical protein